MSIVKGHLKVFANQPDLMAGMLLALTRTPDSGGDKSDGSTLADASSRWLVVAAAKLSHLSSAVCVLWLGLSVHLSTLYR